jgi:hypothetical protein
LASREFSGKRRAGVISEEGKKREEKRGSGEMAVGR